MGRILTMSDVEAPSAAPGLRSRRRRVCRSRTHARYRWVNAGEPELASIDDAPDDAFVATAAAAYGSGCESAGQ